jgi:peptidoglycan hydrolase CwlO-like protein
VRKIWLAFLALLVVLSVTTMVREARAEETPLEDLMIQTTAGEIDNTLAGFNITAIGLNSQAQTQVDILNQLSEINADLQEISTQLTSIENAIELETCTESLSSSDVIEPFHPLRRSSMSTTTS